MFIPFLAEIAKIMRRIMKLVNISFPIDSKPPKLTIL